MRRDTNMIYPGGFVYIVLSVTGILSAAGSYFGGDGSKDDPYQILTATHLMELSEHTEDYDECFILLADIDMDPVLPGNQTWQQAVIAPPESNSDSYDGMGFSGTFDGNGYSIKNITFEFPGTPFLGLFGSISAEGVIVDLNVENTTVIVYYSKYFLGFLAGENNGLVMNCHTTGSIERDYWYDYDYYVGGLLGKNNGIVFDCSSEGTIRGDSYVGGLIGWDASGYVQKCHSSCSIEDCGNYSGGLIGLAEGTSTITYCYATGSLNDTSNSSTGALIGKCYGDSIEELVVSRCYATGSGFYSGLIGYTYHCTIKNCYSVGQVNYYGLAGGSWYCEETGSFWDTDTSGTSYSYGYGTGLETASMKQQQTFVDAGWDFDSTWQMIEGRTYPYFQWQDAHPLDGLCLDGAAYPVGDLNYDCVVNLEDFLLFSSHWMEDLRTL